MKTSNLEKRGRLSKWMIILALFMCAEVSLAGGGNELGNGGDVVVCRDPKTKKITKSPEALDLYEGRIIRRLDPKLLSNSISVEENLFVILGYLFGVDKALGNQVREQMIYYLEKVDSLKGAIFEDIPDSGHLFFPENCGVEQLIINRPPTSELDKVYFIKQELWVEMDVINKTAMIFHEVLYSLALKRNPMLPNSIPVRTVNSIILSGKYSNVSLAERIKMRQLFLTENEPIFIFGSKFRSELKGHFGSTPFVVLSATEPGQEVEIFNQRIKFLRDVYLQGTIRVNKKNDIVSISGIDPGSPLVVNLQGKDREVLSFLTEFPPDLQYYLKNEEVFTSIKGENIYCKGSISLYTKGETKEALRSCDLSRKYIGVDHKQKSASCDKNVRFNLKGEIIECKGNLY